MAESTRMFSSYRLIGIIGVLGVILTAMIVGGDVRIYIHLPSVLILLGVSFFALLATFHGDFLRFIPDAIATLFCSGTKANPKFAQISLFASRYIIGSAIIGTLIGMVQMLQNLSSPNDIGYGLATVLLTLLYSVVISEFFCALLYKSYSDGDQTFSKPLPAKNVILPIATTLTIIISLFIALTKFMRF